MNVWLKTQEQDKTLIHLYIQPGASKTTFVGFFGDPERLKLRIKSPPVEGLANKEVIKFMAKTLGIRKSDIVFIRGELSRNKDILVDLPHDCTLEIILEYIR